MVEERAIKGCLFLGRHGVGLFLAAARSKRAVKICIGLTGKLEVWTEIIIQKD